MSAMCVCVRLFCVHLPLLNKQDLCVMGEQPWQYLSESASMIVFCSRIFVYKNCTLELSHVCANKSVALCVHVGSLFMYLLIIMHSLCICAGTSFFSFY